MFKQIIYNCEKAQRLSIKRQESRLTPAEFLQLKIHMRYCDVCRGFERFSARINRLFQGERQGLEEQPSHKLSPEEKEEWQKRIDELSQ